MALLLRQSDQERQHVLRTGMKRVADALTADGVPASAIRLTAAADGSGGFVQLVY